jgi:hypothetical protein
MTITTWRSQFWWHWVTANSLAELVGLGTVAVLGYVIASRVGEPHGILQAIGFASVFVLLGAFEGLVVGWAQAKVLKPRLPKLTGWARATVVGAAVSWTLGMAPSTIMSLGQASEANPPPEISEPLRLLLAAGLGLIAGPALAFFQWRLLRRHVPRAGWWLPANAIAWAVGMPIIFLGAHMSAYTTLPLLVALGVGAALLIAGAAVGVIHGRVLLWLLSSRKSVETR